MSAWSAISWLCPCGTSKMFCCKMSPKTDPETRYRVEALLRLFTSNKKLLENLQDSGKTVSLSTIERFRRKKKMEAKGWKKPPRKLPKHLQPHQDRKSHSKKIAKWIDPKNPLTISEMARRLGMSRWYVRNILRNILDICEVKKRKVQELTDQQKAQRYEHGEKFLKNT